MILSGESAAKWSGVLRGGKFFCGLSLTEVVGLTVITNHFLWLCSKWTRPHLVDIFRAIHKNGGIYKKIPLYAEFVKRVLENLLKWRGNSMTYLASIGITNAVLACISCSENGHRKARWQQNDNDFCIKNIVQHYIDYISLHCHRPWSGRPQRCSGHVGRREWERKVLGNRTEWPEKSGRRGYFYRMYR